MPIQPDLKLPNRMEDCVMRIMVQTKTCPTAMKLLTQDVVKFTWADGPWVVGHSMSSFFPIGSNLNSSTHEEWAKLSVQTALGQTLALEIGNAIFEASNKKLDCEDEWSVMLVSCGLWVQVKDKLIPSLLMGSAAVGALDQAVLRDPGFRPDLAAASSKEPPVNMSGHWRLGRVVDDSGQRVAPGQAGRCCSCWRKWRKPSFKTDRGQRSSGTGII